MELLDQREWDVLAAIESYGVRLGVRSNDPGMIDQLAEILPYNHKPLVEASPTVDRLYSIWIDGDGEAILYVDAHLHGRGRFRRC